MSESDSARAAAGAHLEIAVPLPDDWLGTALAFTVSVERDGIIVEQHPQRQPIRVQVPGPDFDASHWRV